MTFSVLAIDDETNMKYLWADMADEGLSMRVADNVDDAFGMLSSETPHLVILDRMMPGRHLFPDVPELEVGLQCYKKIRRENPALPVVILTNYYEGELGRSMEEKDSRLRFLDKNLQNDRILYAVAALLRNEYPSPEPEVDTSGSGTSGNEATGEA